MMDHSITPKSLGTLPINMVKTDARLENNLNNAILYNDKQLFETSHITIHYYRVIKVLTTICNFITNNIFDCKLFNNKSIKEWNITLTKIVNTKEQLSKIKFINPITLRVVNLPASLLPSFISYDKFKKIAAHIESNNLQKAEDYIKNKIILDKDYNKLELDINDDNFVSDFFHDKHVFKQNDLVINREVNDEALAQLDDRAIPAILNWLVENKVNILSFLLNSDKSKLNLIFNSDEEIINYLKKINSSEKNISDEDVKKFLENQKLYTSEDDKTKKMSSIKYAKYITEDNQIDLEYLLNALQGEELQPLFDHFTDTGIDISPYINQLTVEQLSVIPNNLLQDIVTKMKDHSKINYNYLVRLYRDLSNDIMSTLEEGGLPITEETQTNIYCYFKLINSGLIDHCKIIPQVNGVTLLAKFIELNLHDEAILLLESLKLSLDKKTLSSNDIKAYLEYNHQNKNILLDILEKIDNINPRVMTFLLDLLKELNFNFNLKNESDETVLLVLAKQYNHKALKVLNEYLWFDDYNVKNRNGETIFDILKKMVNKDPCNQDLKESYKIIYNNTKFTSYFYRSFLEQATTCGNDFQTKISPAWGKAKNACHNLWHSKGVNAACSTAKYIGTDYVIPFLSKLYSTLNAEKTK